MSTTNWLSLLGFWGVWLILPIVVDGLQATHFFLSVVTRRVRPMPIGPVSPPNGRWPLVTVLVPIYNSAGNLGQCLDSIRRQSYPLNMIEVLCIDNGSSDDSYQFFQREQARPFAGRMHWMSTFLQGKPWALNVGVHHAMGQYIINIDSDVTIHEDAIANMVAAFESNPGLMAATGAVEIEPRSNEGGFLRIVHEAEFQEYYSSFYVGRRFESRSGRLFTLAGAFSAFRRETLFTTHLYDTSTVGEDTFMTFSVQQKYGGHSVSAVPTAVCYTEPIPSLRALYSQRARWQRGQIEVMACYPDLVRRGLLYRGFSPIRTLVIDHTMAFPRIAWTFLMPALAFFGYNWLTIATATGVLYLGYAAIEVLTFATSALLVVKPSARRLRRGWWLIPLMPAYRYFIFWMRFSGALTVLTEAHQWRTTDPVNASRAYASKLVQRAAHPDNEKAA